MSARPPVYVSALELDDARPFDRVRFVRVGDAVRMVVEGTAEFDAPIALDCTVEEYRRVVAACEAAGVRMVAQ